MKGPDAMRARPLAERFADLESRINTLRAHHEATPPEHSVADLLNELRRGCDKVRSHVAAIPADTAEPPATHSSSVRQKAETAIHELEEAYEKALRRFRG